MTESAPPIAPHVERILEAARIAPSRDNLQPWRFVVDGETVSFLVDRERDRSADDRGRMARIAVGAAIECALLRAARMGAIVRELPPRPGALVTLSFSSPKRTPEPDKALVRRTTNRHLFDGRPVDDATFAWLREATPPIDLARTLWFGRERVKTLGPIVEEAETLFFGDARNREAALAAVRFDVRDREEVTHGLSLTCMELSAPERIAFDALRKMPQERLAAMGVFKKMGSRARRLMESASGVCMVTASGDEPLTDVAAGRSMQRAWLALTRRGLVAHPMSAIPALDALPKPGEAVAAVLDWARTAFPNLERTARIAVLMRFGWGPTPTARVGRLALEESVALGPAAGAPSRPSDSPSAPSGTIRSS